MVSYDKPIPMKNKGFNHKKKPRNDQANAAPSEYGRTYVIDLLNLVNLQMTSKMNPNDSSHNVGKDRRQTKIIRITALNENVTYYLILNPTKRAKSKISHYSPIVQGFLSTRSRRGKFRKFRIVLNRGISSTVLMDSLTSTI